MRVLEFCLALLMLFPAYATTEETGESESLPSMNADNYQALPRSYMSLMYDPGLTMRSGAENLLTLHGGLAWTEDRFIKTRWFSESKFLGKSAGILCRFGKYALVDVPVDYFLPVLSHEFFGHGARYREFGIEDVHYGFGWPPPYGDDGGEATASIGPGIISMQELTAILAGGVEAQSTIMNQALSLRWTVKKEMTYREASTFFWSWDIMFEYVQGTEDALSAVVDDNDISVYVRLLNQHAGYEDPDSLLMDIKYLKNRTYLSLVNPYLYYSLYSMVKTYLWDGEISTDIPMLNIGGVQYLPAFRVVWAPFGLEYHMDNFLRVKKRAVWLNLRIGDQTFYKSWGGVGVLVKNFFESNRFSLDVRLDVWKQPEIELGDPRVYKGGGLGGGFSLRGYYHFTGPQDPIAAVLELGYKSPGFLEGYVLDSSPILMFGFAINH